MSSSHAQPTPKAPAERTLVMAVIALALVAIIQLVAAGIALAPRLDLEKWVRAMAPHPASSAASAISSGASEDNAGKANELLDEAQTFRNAGNFQGAFEAVTEADRLLPNTIGILSALANDCAMLQKNAELVAACKKIVALPASADPLDASIRAQAQKVLAQVSGGKAAPATSAPVEAKGSAGTRDDIGIPVGSVMGIVDVKFADGSPGQKNLSVATKGASGQKIDPAKFQATVDFYEQDDHSQIVYDESHPPVDWLSTPIDWANGEPEIFQLKYRLPLEDRGDLPPLQYYGYVVAIYYNGELQDQRADPPSLLNDHAPSLHKDLPAE